MVALLREIGRVVGRLAACGDQSRIPDIGHERQVQRFEDLVRHQRATDGVRPALLEYLFPQFERTTRVDSARSVRLTSSCVSASWRPRAASRCSPVIVIGAPPTRRFSCAAIAARPSDVAASCRTSSEGLPCRVEIGLQPRIVPAKLVVGGRQVEHHTVDIVADACCMNQCLARLGGVHIGRRRIQPVFAQDGFDW